jgi:hypothetical protein
MIVFNFQLGLISEIHDTSQFNWNVCKCLQDVSKKYFVYHDLVRVFNF